MAEKDRAFAHPEPVELEVDVGTMDERRIGEVAVAVGAQFGRDVKVIPGSLPKGSPHRRVPDTSKITALGYEGPKTGFTEGLARTAEWYRAHAA